MQKPSPNDARVLIVDDEKDIASTMKMGLERAGFKVDAFHEPFRALHEFMPRKYDLVLIDVKMPHMDGFALYRRLSEIDAGIKVCFMTAYPDDSIFREQLPDLQRVAIVKKPIHLKGLVQLLRAEMDAKATTPSKSCKREASLA